MRARCPDHEGHVDRDGVKIAYQVYDHDAPTILLLPAWSLVHSRLWKAQVAYLARHWRVVSYDPRGNGGSDRPTHPASYDDRVLTGDAAAVLDATGTESAVVVGLSRGARYAALLAAGAPDRVLGAVLIAPSIPVGAPHPRLDPRHFAIDWENPEGWQKWNAHHWRRDWPDFVGFFAREVFPEPHSTKQVEDTVDWGTSTTGEVGVATMARTLPAEEWEQTLRSLRAPVLVVQGDADTVTPPDWGTRVAELTGAELVIMPGSGHAPNARHPVVVNRHIHAFAQRVTGRRTCGRPRPAPGAGRRSGGRGTTRVLFLSSPIGLGHVRRDLAIAEELRTRVDGLQVDWLTQHPATRVLAEHGEQVHPASAQLANESAHLASESGEHDLHCFDAFRRMDEILVANFMLLQEVLEETRYDLVIADEAWDLDHFWHEHPQLKRAPLVWLTDFVGFTPVPGADERERGLVRDYNAEMVEHVESAGGVRDLSLFVGNRDDVVPGTFGEGLPSTREWTERHFSFPGYVTGFDPTPLGDRDRLRRDLGYRADEPVCVVAVGGSGVGEHLLRRAAEALPLLRRQYVDARMVLVAGPRLDVASLPRAEGLDVRAYVPGLFRHLAAADAAVVQGGLTTTMELTALQRPFAYLPLRNHFEQQVHVRHRLDRYGAGTHLDYTTADPDRIAATVADLFGSRPTYRPVETDGAARAADAIALLL